MEEADEIMSSVAPTLQCCGYTGTAYANTSLYIPGEVDDITRELGGNDVNDESVWVCVMVLDARLYSER